MTSSVTTAPHPTYRKRIPIALNSAVRNCGGSTVRSAGAPTSAKKSVPPTHTIAAIMCVATTAMYNITSLCTDNRERVRRHVHTP